MLEINKLHHVDCMDALHDIPDGFFELAIVDPPYGIGESSRRRENNKTDKWGNPHKAKYAPEHWDDKPESYEYFKELLRVSQNQIIWGAHHFISKIPIDSPCWIVWDKRNGSTDFADCELAWTSFSSAVRKFEYLWNGFQKQAPEVRFHPTQKPVALYEWILRKYARPGDKILDTHAGSASCAVACIWKGFDWMAMEINEGYCAKAQERIEWAFKEAESERAQMRLEGI